MKKTVFSALFLSVFGLQTANLARADISESISASMTGEGGVQPWAVQLNSELAGVASQLNPKAPARFTNALGLQYFVAPGITVGATVLSDIFQGTGWSSKDPFISVRTHRLIDQGAFTTSAQLRIYPAMTDVSKNSGVLAGVRAGTDSIYRIPNTRFRVGLNAYVHVPIYHDAQTGASDRKIYLAPRIEYRFHPRWRAVTTYKHWTSHRNNARQLDMPTDLSTFQLSAIWEATPRLYVIPTMDFNRVNAAVSDTVTAGGIVSWRML